MSGLPFPARALFDYEAVESTELSLTTGDAVTIEEVNESGWSLARLTPTRIGWIPTDYIERVAAHTDDPSHSPAPAPITAERPQPNPQAAPQPLTPAASPDAEEEEVATLRITTEPAPTSPTPPATSAPTPAPASTAAAGGQAPLDLSSLTSVLPATVPVTASAPTTAAPIPSPLPPGAVKECAACHEPIRSAFVMAKDLLFHPNHFTCGHCHAPLGGKAYLEKDGQFYCEADYYTLFNPRCQACQETIQGPYVSALGATWHPHHFTCAHCQQPFPSQQYRQHEDKAYCDLHYAALFAPQCHTCHQPVVGAVFEALGRKYHLACFVCVEGYHPIGEGVMFHLHEGDVYCPEHFEKKFLRTCVACQQTIRGQFIKLGDQDFYHPECWACHRCKQVLRVDTCAQYDAHFYCKGCVAEVNKTPILSLVSSAVASRAASNANSPLPPTQPSLSIPVSPLGRAQVPRAAEVVPLTASSEAPPAKVEYSEPETMGAVAYEVLKDAEQRPKEVDPKRKELYLGDDEFVQVFGVTKQAFQALPLWKRAEQKKKQGLF